MASTNRAPLAAQRDEKEFIIKKRPTMVRMIEATNEIHNPLRKRQTMQESEINAINNWMPGNQ